MSKHQNLLFMIADAEHVRFVRPAADNTLHSDTALDPLSNPKASAEPGSGRTSESCQTGSSPHRERTLHHDMYALEKAKFSRAIGAKLNAAANTFDELVIVAPLHTLVAVRQRLNAATDAKIIGTLPQDLAKTPDDELWPLLRWWIRPTRSSNTQASQPTRD
jgi:protein required for attachment to host cells